MQAGSWTTVFAAVQSLYTTLFNRTDGVATALKTAIKNSTYVTDTDNNGTLENVANYNYPGELGLPDGAARISWDNTNKEFKVELSSDNTGLDVAAIDKFVFPASLYYFGVSDIKTAKTEIEHDGENKTWEQITGSYPTSYSDDPAYNCAEVSSKTRSIALIDEVQYGVARLDVGVKAASTTLADNDGNTVTVTATSFPITGILVGNQRNANYKFEPKDATASATLYTVYDGQVAGSSVYMYPGTNPPETANKTHTLVLESVDATGDGTAANDPGDVTIAIEFRNDSGKDFVGHDKQVIYQGTKFYLIGILKPGANTTYKYKRDVDNVKKTANAIKRAFVQDYHTVANFVVKNLWNAFNTVPDMRNPHLEIGLSVDVKWEEGIVFDNIDME